MADEIGAGDLATAPVVVRLASRGKVDSKASDFGGLEVFGGASIGHTDPFSILPFLYSNIGSEHAISSSAAFLKA
eukprot:scaffold647941_cov25-Prasinocladus_malaysianus.AAC.1